LIVLVFRFSNLLYFLAAYAKAMKPVGDVLQGDETMLGYLCHLVPTTMGLKCKLSQSTDRVVEPLVKALSSGIDSSIPSCVDR